MQTNVQSYFKDLQLPAANSHKGQNGKLLLIGGSELFHAASKWSLDIASHFVDMVFYASVPSNNQLIREAKKEFWNGIVIERDEVKNYVKEADVILIGPGMERTVETETLTNELLKNPPLDNAPKKWVLDAGALQMVETNLLHFDCIITPHQGELERIWNKVFPTQNLFELEKTAALTQLSAALGKVNILLKGQTDYVCQTETVEAISGGNPGLTKGGTGDVLAGLVAALYCTNSALTSAVVASYVNKKAGEDLAKNVGPFFNASELVQQIPQTLWSELQQIST